MRIGRLFINIIFVFLLCTSSTLLAQPNYATKQTISDVTVFQDKTDPFLFYYLPGNLTLKYTKNDTPDFQFLDMRYTGSKCYNDIGEVSFMSAIQFGVAIEKIPTQTLNYIKKALKKRKSIKLKPLQISHINTRLVLPVEGNTEKNYETIDNDGSLEAKDKSGFSTSKSFWTNRTYTVKLTKHESQLLNKQLKNDLLAISLNYSYSANVYIIDEEISGSKELIEEFEKDSVTGNENNLQNRILKSNTLNIQVDLNKYPETIKQIDINEEIPPAYAAIEIKCHDFLENLRPDLYMKIIELEAVSVNNDKPTSIKTKFLKSQPDLYTQHINFPYAVQINAPMRYRITEIDVSGEQTITDWIDKLECSSIIDVTSKANEQLIESKVLDAEIEQGVFENDSLEKIELNVFYFLNEKIETKTIVFSPNDEFPLQTIWYKADKNMPSFYVIKKYKTDGDILIGEEQELNNDYLYINE